ncbi:hypothetical protein EJ05DRAFT_489465 [Pseudovirgaria hyperparasitica]|uniref:Uncharacterized protein n=1 Tax=Pseudovirgaria hyperparasitica TaxID=470096 RepID=A0A6A6VU60_9PEZI|nr:uncharacterized protein EJ05DRAFT_489465 [Pseudovirgaria hyperparasitica]KAF2754228.1 hypothetical protein EJ05DRAFT_489465 [Pseudovirgaria hyperparasitica]
MSSNHDDHDPLFYHHFDAPPVVPEPNSAEARTESNEHHPQSTDDNSVHTAQTTSSNPEDDVDNITAVTAPSHEQATCEDPPANSTTETPSVSGTGSILHTPSTELPPYQERSDTYPFTALESNVEAHTHRFGESSRSAVPLRPVQCKVTTRSGPETRDPARGPVRTAPYPKQPGSAVTTTVSPLQDASDSVRVASTPAPTTHSAEGITFNPPVSQNDWPNLPGNQETGPPENSIRGRVAEFRELCRQKSASWFYYLPKHIWKKFCWQMKNDSDYRLKRTPYLCKVARYETTSPSLQ